MPTTASAGIPFRVPVRSRSGGDVGEGRCARASSLTRLRGGRVMAQQALNAVVLGSVYVLFSLGLSLAWGVANVLNLAHSALFVIGALVSFEIGRAVALPL